MESIQQRYKCHSHRTLLGVIAGQKFASPLNEFGVILAEEVCNGLDVDNDVSAWQCVGYVVCIANAELLVFGQANPIHIAQIANHILHLRSYVYAHSRAEGVDEIVLGIRVVAESVADSTRTATAIFAEQLGTMDRHLLVEVVAIAEHSLALLVVDAFVHKG